MYRNNNEIIQTHACTFFNIFIIYVHVCEFIHIHIMPQVYTRIIKTRGERRRRMLERSIRITKIVKNPEIYPSSLNRKIPTSAARLETCTSRMPMHVCTYMSEYVRMFAYKYYMCAYIYTCTYGHINM